MKGPNISISYQANNEPTFTFALSDEDAQRFDFLTRELKEGPHEVFQRAIAVLLQRVQSGR